MIPRRSYAKLRTSQFEYPLILVSFLQEPLETFIEQRSPGANIFPAHDKLASKLHFGLVRIFFNLTLTRPPFAVKTPFPLLVLKYCKYAFSYLISLLSLFF